MIRLLVVAADVAEVAFWCAGLVGAGVVVSALIGVTIGKLIAGPELETPAPPTFRNVVLIARDASPASRVAGSGETAAVRPPSRVVAPCRPNRGDASEVPTRPFLPDNLSA